MTTLTKKFHDFLQSFQYNTGTVLQYRPRSNLYQDEFEVDSLLEYFAYGLHHQGDEVDNTHLRNVSKLL